ncbi:polyprenyl synthetase family protein [Pseudaestuariivita atlantica]|uniref:Geranylgeranyl diphosphate synthase n=1 Tax=Pseudaestuariivita atlantica TaxID=1317121 RepID=A0A0L1JPA9_9RHOB|nr:farnesyl diphosphate synthase [Pseudaestuariivita atlantica]KNG93547.1 farnesyl-diphosphate synthase [Pseudaestuariivita atlantica]
MSVDLKRDLAAAQARVEARLDRALHHDRGDLADAMRHAMIGGKGLRGFLVTESARLHGVAEDDAVHAACAVEALHAYSLVHDDLPCMDDDDLRRGQPTVHRKWSEAVAVLAGDALQTLCFELLAEAPNAVAMVRSMAEAAGRGGMVGGQMRDIAAETAAEPLSLEEITLLQAGKTGALLTWAASAGPRMAGADEGALLEYGQCIGLAFQIADDILDVEGDAGTVGKAVGKDEAAGKATFVSILGLDEAKRRAADIVDVAVSALSVYGEDAAKLRELAHFVISRKS